MINVQVDISDFRRDLKNYFSAQYPESMARGFQALSQSARDAARQRTAEKYKLHSDFIPKGILNTPQTDAQIAAAAKSIDRHHDIQASVFLRPSGDVTKSLGFMVPHETGDNKTPRGSMIAIPSYGIEGYSFRTSRGGVKTKYTPSELLKDYPKGGSRLPPAVVAGLIQDAQQGKGKPGRKKGEAFVTVSKGGVPMIARRKGGGRLPLEVLYVMKKAVKSDGNWGFETTVQATVVNKYRGVLARYINK